MKSNLREPVQRTENNETNRSPFNGKKPMKRTANIVDLTETSTGLSSKKITSISTNTRSEHNCDGIVPTKKAKVLPNNSDQASEKFNDVSSCARTTGLGSIDFKCHNKNVLRGIVTFDTSMNRLNPGTMEHGKSSIEQFKLLMHAINLSIEDNYELLALLKVLDSSTVVNDIYCLKKQTDYKELYSFVEVKYFPENRTINYKQLMGPEFDLRRYFKIFLYLKKTYKITGDIKIYCNRDLNRGAFQNNDIRIISPDGNLCKLRVHQNHNIRRILLDYCILPNLAKKILECMNGNKAITKKFKLLQKYHVALVREEVLEVATEERDGSFVGIARFHNNFVKEKENVKLSESARELRRYLIKNLPSGQNHITRDMSCEVYDDFGKDDGNSVLNLPHENCSELFETFFEGLHFEMIDDADVDITMKDKFGDDFTKIEGELPLKLIEGEIYLHFEERRSNDLFQSIKNIMSQFTIKKELSKVSEPKINVKFEQKVLREFGQFFGENDSQSVILYRSDYIHLSTLKIKQSTNRITNNAWESLFITSKTLLERPDNVISVLASNLIYILVIQFDQKSNGNEVGIVLTKLERCINVGKYVIVVSNTNSSKELHYGFKRIIDENNLFDLTSKSESRVLKCKNVHFHGQSFRITDIGEDKVVGELIRDPKLLENILFEKVIVGRDLIKPNGFTEKLFTMQLTQYVTINEAVFRKDSYDIFGISNIDEDFRKYIPCEKEYEICRFHEMEQYSKFILLSAEDDLESRLQEISKKRMECNVHLMKYKSGKFIWKKTIGRKDGLIEFRIADNRKDEILSGHGNADLCEDKKIFDELSNDSKTTIISGQSGIGKSVCLYELAQRLLTSKDPLWIIQLNLSEKLFEQYSENNMLDCKKFLVTAIGFNEACKKIFNMAMDEELKLKIVLFIDDYDMLRKNTSISLMEDLLKQLQTSRVHKIYVASNVKTTQRLERTLDIFSYSLEFSGDEKEQFLQKYQSNNSLEIPAHLTNTPLHLRMLAGLCRQGVKDFKCLKDFHGLYREYVKLKLKNSDFELARNIAINNLLENREFYIPDLHLPKIEVKFQFPEELQHETFTEYFAARWLFRKFRQYSEERSKFVDFLMRLKECTSPVFVVSYYSSLFALDSLVDDLFEAAETGNIDEIERLLKNDCLVNVRDESGKSLLHRVNDDKTTEFLIGKELFDVDATDSEGQTALHLVAEKDLLNCTTLLLKAGASYDVKDLQGKRSYNYQNDENKSVKVLRMIDELFTDLKSDDPKIFVPRNPDILANYLLEAEKIYGIAPEIIVNVKDETKKTLLNYTEEMNYSSIATSLKKCCTMDGVGNEDEKGKMNSVGSTTEDKTKDKSGAESQNILPKRPGMEVAQLPEIIVETTKTSDPNMERDGLTKYYDEREISLKVVEANVLPSNSWLNDESIDAFMRILQKTHSDITTQSTLYQDLRKKIPIKTVTAQQQPSIEIIGGSCINHWRCLYFDGKTIRIYDSKYSEATKLSTTEEKYVRLRYPSVASCRIKFVKLLTEQPDSHSCGVYAVAFAETLSSDGDPASVRYSLDVNEMRRHFVECVRMGRTYPFPREKKVK